MEELLIAARDLWLVRGVITYGSSGMRAFLYE